MILAGAIDTDWYIDDIANDKLIYDSKNYYKFNKADERIYAGIYFIKSGMAGKLFYSNFIKKKKINNITYSVNASALVKEFVVKNGINPDEFIIYGKNIKRTIDEAIEFKRYLKNIDLRNILLVTSERHMRRAFNIFDARGVSLDRYSVETGLPLNINLIKISNYIPSAYGLKMTKDSLYELFGYIGYWLKGDI